MQSLFPGDLEVSRPTTPCGTVIPHPPLFKIKLKEVTEILTGSTVRFALLVKGHPSPALSFLKDNEPLVANDRVKIICHRPEAYELVIEKAAQSDSATYSITALNHLGSDTTTGKLRVTSDKVMFPELSSSESSRSATPRPGTPLFRWYKNGIEFEAEDRFQCEFSEESNTIALIFQRVTSRDAGVYTCVAKTKRGKISCTAELKSEKTKAIFKRALTDFEARDGDEEVDLIVKLDGSPKPNVRWFFSGKEISEEDGFRFISKSEENTHILRIQKVHKSMDGVFTCEAFNCEGKSETSGKLTVLSKPVFLDPLRDLEVANGVDVCLKVQITGFPNPEISWLRNSVPIAANYDKFETTTDADIHKVLIRDFSHDDAAEYTCEASNVLGRVASSCRIRVSDKPCFKKRLQDRNVQMNDENIVFSVEFEPEPPISNLKWFVDDIEIVSMDKRYEIVSRPSNTNFVYQLKVKNANEGTAGTYMCIASNESGKSFSSAQLRVASRPEFMQGLEDRQVMSGDSVAMDVVISGNPVPDVKWLRNGKEITDDSNITIEKESEFVHILTVEKVTLEAMADYECVIKNEVGECRTKGRLTITNPQNGNGFQDMGIGNFRVTIDPDSNAGQTPVVSGTAAIDGTISKLGSADAFVYNKNPAIASLKISDENVSVFGNKPAGQKPEGKLINDSITGVGSEITGSIEPVKLEAIRSDFLCLKTKVSDHDVHKVKWLVLQKYMHETVLKCFLLLDNRLLEGHEIDIVKSKYCQTVEDDGTVRLVVRNPKACDAGLYSIRVGDMIVAPESGIQVEVQSKSESLFERLVATVNTCITRSRKIVSHDNSQYRERTLIVGGFAVMAGMYLMMRSLFSNPLNDADALSQAFTENVKEWVYKCGSAISSCTGSSG